MHPFAELERNYRELQETTFKLETLAYNHSSIDYDPVGDPADLEAEDEWVEEKMNDILPWAKELRKETGRSFVNTRRYEGETGEEAEELRSFWHAQYFKFGDAIRRMSSEFDEVEYRATDVDTAAAYAEAVAEIGGIDDE